MAVFNLFNVAQSVWVYSKNHCTTMKCMIQWKCVQFLIEILIVGPFWLDRTVAKVMDFLSPLKSNYNSQEPISNLTIRYFARRRGLLPCDRQPVPHPPVRLVTNTVSPRHPYVEPIFFYGSKLFNDTKRIIGNPCKAISLRQKNYLGLWICMRIYFSKLIVKHRILSTKFESRDNRNINETYIF